MPSKKGVAYIKPGQAEVRNIEYLTFKFKKRPRIYSANAGRTDQCSVMRYHRELLMAILNERFPIA